MMNMLKQSDNIALLKAGFAPAFEQIIRSHNQRLFRLARAILRDAFEAEDVVQEAYIKVFLIWSVLGRLRTMVLGWHGLPLIWRFRACARKNGMRV